MTNNKVKMSKIELTEKQINFLATCCSKDPGKGVFQHIYFNTNGYAYSTDGHRMAAVAIPELEHTYLVNAAKLSSIKDQRLFDLEAINVEKNCNYPQAKLLLPRQFQSTTHFTNLGADQFSKISDSLLAKKKLNIAFSIKNNQVIYTEGMGFRWLPPLTLEFSKNDKGIVQSVKTNGVFDTIVLNPVLLDALEYHQWNKLESSGLGSPVVFGNGYGKDYFLVMPCGKQCEALDQLFNNLI